MWCNQRQDSLVHDLDLVAVIRHVQTSECIGEGVRKGGALPLTLSLKVDEWKASSEVRGDPLHRLGALDADEEKSDVPTVFGHVLQ
jgi:hypothetical protein